MRTGLIAVVVVLAIFSGGCDREKRDFTSNSGVAAHTARLTDLQPGAPSPPPVTQSPLNGNAYGLSEGKRLFSWFNCVGCHHHGGGGIGPALMDHRWIYGSRPDQIYSAIVQGRPNGMPSYAGRLTDQQVWQLVAYVESLAGNAAKDAAPGREDDMSSSKPEMRREPRPPVQTGHR